MAKNSKPNKKARREQETKQAKRKTGLFIALIAALLLAVIGGLALGAIRAIGTETYSDGNQTVTLSRDGTFTAELAHNNRKSGAYVMSEGEDGVTVIGFTASGVTDSGLIEGGALHIPVEWDDGHGHNRILPKR